MSTLWQTRYESELLLVLVKLYDIYFHEIKNILLKF